MVIICEDRVDPHVQIAFRLLRIVRVENVHPYPVLMRLPDSLFNILRRIEFESQKHENSAPVSVTVGKLTLDEDRRCILGDCKPLALSPTEYDVLKYLMQHADQAVSREELLNTVWGFESVVETRATDDTIRRLRQKLGDCGVSIAAVWGYGFRLEESK